MLYVNKKSLQLDTLQLRTVAGAEEAVPANGLQVPCGGRLRSTPDTYEAMNPPNAVAATTLTN
jgi:hypothetical protein